MEGIQQQFVVSIMSQDRVGIVHEVSEAISELNGNIADIRQSVLSGFFTMILLASFPEPITQRSIEKKLAEVNARSDTAIDIAIKQVDSNQPVTTQPNPENIYVLTASGTDKIGFVATVTSFCVKHQINILDLSTTTSEDAYLMVLMIDINHLMSISQIRADLHQFSQDTGLNVVLQHYDIFRAVNEIKLPIR